MGEVEEFEAIRASRTRLQRALVKWVVHLLATIAIGVLAWRSAFGLSPVAYCIAGVSAGFCLGALNERLRMGVYHG